MYGIVPTMKVDLVDHMGSDLTVVNAARVSLIKKVTGTIGEIKTMVI